MGSTSPSVCNRRCWPATLPESGKRTTELWEQELVADNQRTLRKGLPGPKVGSRVRVCAGSFRPHRDAEKVAGAL